MDQIQEELTDSGEKGRTSKLAVESSVSKPSKARKSSAAEDWRRRFQERAGGGSALAGREE